MMQHSWVFQLSRTLSPEEKAAFQAQMEDFLVQWKSHGAPVPGTSELRYDRFVLVQAVPGTTSGCSIDSMTRGVNQLVQQMGLTLLGPEHVFYLDENGSLGYLDFRELDKACSDGRLKGDTIVFDSSLGQKGDIRLWQVRLQDTWMSRYLPKTLA